MQLLLGATLIDGTGAAPVPDAAVLINDGRISAVGPRQTVSRPAHVDVIDLSGLTLLPGLIDGHDHLASHGYAFTQRWGCMSPSVPCICAQLPYCGRPWPLAIPPYATPLVLTLVLSWPSKRV